MGFIMCSSFIFQFLCFYVFSISHIEWRYHHLFRKCPFFPRCSWVRCLPMWSLATYPCLFRLQTKQFHHSHILSKSSCSYTLPLLPPHFYRLIDATSMFLQADRCPNHLNLPCLATSASLYTQKRLQILTLLSISRWHSTHPSRHHTHRPLQIMQIYSLHRPFFSPIPICPHALETSSGLSRWWVCWVNINGNSIFKIIFRIPFIFIPIWFVYLSESAEKTRVESHLSRIVFKSCCSRFWSAILSCSEMHVMIGMASNFGCWVSYIAIEQLIDQGGVWFLWSSVIICLIKFVDRRLHPVNYFLFDLPTWIV